MILALLNIRFVWEPHLLSKWPKQAQSLSHKLKKRFEVLVRTPQEPFSLMIILVGDHKDILQQYCDAIVEQCALHGIGRIEDELRTFHPLDCFYESDEED